MHISTKKTLQNFSTSEFPSFLKTAYQTCSYTYIKWLVFLASRFAPRSSALDLVNQNLGGWATEPFFPPTNTLGWFTRIQRNSSWVSQKRGFPSVTALKFYKEYVIPSPYILRFCSSVLYFQSFNLKFSPILTCTHTTPANRSCSQLQASHSFSITVFNNMVHTMALLLIFQYLFLKPAVIYVRFIYYTTNMHLQLLTRYVPLDQQ